MLQKGWVSRLVCLAAAIFVTAVIFPIFSIANDPPHNEASGIGCSDCHGQLLLESQSPFYTENTSDLAYNSICLNCHGEGEIVGYGTGNVYHSAIAPKVASHAPGGTAIKCTDCHHNHDQDQLYSGKNEKSKFFIATGTLDTGAPTPLAYNSDNNTTTITYASLSANNGWDLTFLDKKTGDGRGTMLVPNHSSRKRWPVYIIKNINIGAKTITVKGNVASASQLGIFYGQVIRRTLNYESSPGVPADMPKSIKLYDIEGTRAFAYDESGIGTGSDPTMNGICQVCHTQTNHWSSTAEPDDDHYSGLDCMNCHPHNNGFVHGSGGGGTGCIECHGHNAGYEYATGEFSQGKGTFQSHAAHTEDNNNGPFLGCDGCHAINNFPYFKFDSNGNEDEKFTLAETKVCDPCHNDATGIATGTLDNVYVPPWNAGVSLNCITCHAISPDYTNGLPKANSHFDHNGVECEKCHSATYLNGGINDQTVHSDGTYTLTPGPGVDFTYQFSTGGGTCSDISCHGSNSATWGSTFLSCDSCHGYPPEHGDGKDVNEQNDGGKGFHKTTFDSEGLNARGGHIVSYDILEPGTDIYGDPGTGYNECMKCHAIGIHGNGVVEIEIINYFWSTPLEPPQDNYDRPSGFGLWGFDPQYNGVPGNTTTPKTCSNIVCHLGDAPEWSCEGSE